MNLVEFFNSFYTFMAIVALTFVILLYMSRDIKNKKQKKKNL